jgi:predicted permease
MRLLPRLSSLWRNLFRKSRQDQELKEEIDAYLEMLVEQKINEGLAPAEARRAALIEFGGREQVSEKVREARMGHYLETLWQDVRYAVRSLRKHALLSIVVIATLTIGIGLSAGVFTLINGELFRAKIDKDQASYVEVYSAYTKDPARAGRVGGTTLEDYLAFRDRARSLRDVAAWAQVGGTLGDEDAPEVRTLFVTCNFFSLYNPEQPLLGRLLQPADCATANPVVVVSERLWRSRFAADPQIVGKVTHFNGQPMTIVGVTPNFAGQIDGANAWLPYTLQTNLVQRPGENSWLNVGARLQSGFSRGEVAAELALLASQQDRLLPERKTTHIVTDGSQLQRPDFRFNQVWDVFFILGALTCVVFITCANVTTLLLSRAAARHQEIAVRLTLGAGRLRLLRMFLLETLLLAAAAGVASLYFVYHAHGLLPDWLFPSPLDRPPDSRFQPDWRVFTYLAVISLMAGLLAGLAPALQSLKVNLSESLKGRQPFSGGARSGAWLRSLLIGAQVALSMAVLVGAILLVRAYRQMSAGARGFETRQVILMDARQRGIAQKGNAWPDFYRTLAERLEALPGVQSVAFTDLPPTGGIQPSDVQIPGQPARQVRIGRISPAFFATLGIPILKGRALQESDPPDTPFGTNNCPVVVSEELARQFWPNANPLGQTLRRRYTYFNPSGQITQWGSLEVVGVARDISTQRIGGPDDPTIYTPWLPQVPPGLYSALLRLTGDDTALERAIIGATRALSPELRAEARTIQSRIEERLYGFRRFGAIVALLGAIAVGLAVLGIYGVVSFDVSRRTKEIGIRLALGARQRDIYGAVLGVSGRPVAVGLLVGLALALVGASALARSLSKSIVMNTHDPLAFVAAAALLAAVALGAVMGPARRATRVDPLMVLRDE